MGWTEFPYHETTFYREKWYRLPELEKEQTKTDKKLIGSLWRVRRKVVRAGYYFEHKDFTQKQVDKRCLKNMEKFFAVREKDLKRDYSWITGTGYVKLPEMEGDSASNVNRVNSLLFNSITEFTENYGYPTKLKYEARDELLHEAYKESKQEKIRAIWYKDCDYDGVPATVKIIGTQQFWTGKYDAPSGRGDDYDSGGLIGQVHHSLYKVYISVPWYEPVHKDGEGKWLENYGHIGMVHPADLEPMETKTVDEVARAYPDKYSEYLNTVPESARRYLEGITHERIGINRFNHLDISSWQNSEVEIPEQVQWQVIKKKE